MRACPEASNHSRYLAWDMQVLKEQAFHGSDAIAFVEQEEYAALRVILWRCNCFLLIQSLHSICIMMRFEFCIMTFE